MSDVIEREEWDGRGVAIGEVLERLAVQRRPPGGGAPYTLSGVMNLVAYAPDPRELDAMRAVVERLADHQPSRAVLVAEDERGAGIDASVSTNCRLGQDHADVALETVTLTLRGEAVGGAASATVALLRPDLPTVLWWPGPPDPAADGPLERLTAIADRVVTEAGRGAAADGIRALADWVPAADVAVTDLAWAGITSWRRLIAQMVDARSLARLREVRPVATLTHAGREPDAGTLLLAGWLSDLVGPELVVELRPGTGEGEGTLAVDLRGGAGDRTLSIERVAGRAAAAVCVTEPDGTPRRRVLPLPDADRARLLSGELELQRRDPPFERALSGAARAAGR